MVSEKRGLDSEDMQNMIRGALYFSVFNYPLTAPELFHATRSRITFSEFENILSEAVSQGLMWTQDDLYYCFPLDNDTVSRRREGNLSARKIIPVARRMAAVIASFPFVRGIALSGALSKNYHDPRGDIDYFIITAPGRLWICRTLLILAYKLLPRPMKKYWCVNYFISEDHLEIPDKNYFTATEIAWLIPVYNHYLYNSFLDKNQWHREFVPNRPRATAAQCVLPASGLFRTLGEKFFAFGANRLDDFLLRATLKRWSRKFQWLDSVDFELQFRSRKNVSKRHTQGSQNKILKAWQEKQVEYENAHQVSLENVTCSPR